ncbi:MAG: tyrosine-type recombinase/integrase [Flavobacteriales bacterium]
MGVKLREKQLSNGQISFYLDIYHNKTRWYEFLDIKIQRIRPSQEDKERKRLAQEIRTKREHELIVEDNGLQNRKKKLACFVRFFEEYTIEGNRNGMYHSVHKNLQNYMRKEPLSFIRVTPEWLKTFERHLLKKISNNSVVRYMEAISCALNEAVRRKIINRNPWHDIPSIQKLKMQDVFRKAYTIEELQKLASTPVNIEKQIKQAYFFSCFSGLRWSDVNPLRWDEIIVKEIQGKQEYYLYFEQEKTENIEYLPLSDNAIDILQERQEEALDEDKSPYVFPRIKEKDDGRQTVYHRMNRQLKKWAKAAGIDPKKLHFHTGRHSFATNVLESSNEGDLYTVSKLLGHSNIRATQIYAKVRDKRKQAAVKALPRIDFSIETPAPLRMKVV